MIGLPTVSYPNRYVLLAPLLLLILSALISLWAAYDLLLSGPQLLALLAGVSLFFAINQLIVSPEGVAKGLVVMGALAAFYFVGQYAYFDYWTEQGQLADLGRITGSLLPNFVFFTPHPNAVAAFLEGVFLLNLVLIWRTRGLERLSWSLVALLIVYAIAISGSRGAWLGLAIALAIGFPLLLPTPLLRLSVTSVVIGAGVLGFCGLVYLASFSQQLPLLESLPATFQSRYILYRNVFHLMGDYPFTGIGLGNTFAMVYSRYQLLIPWSFLTYAHNIFLAVGLGQGMLGLIALIWLLVRFYGFVAQVEWANIQGARASLLFRAAWLGVTATFIHGLLDAAQFSNDCWTLPMLFALLALAVTTGRSLPLYARETKKGTVGRAIKKYPYMLPAVVGLSLILVGFIYRQALLSRWYVNLGAVYQTQADLSPKLDAGQRDIVLATAINYFERSLELNDAQPVANRRLGMIALDYQQFDLAVSYLEQAYPQEPKNQATLKALGYAYLWTGQLEPAHKLLHQLDDRSELMQELHDWRNWWQSQDRTELAGYADQMIRLLSTKKG